jgi:hypothetical protein
LAGCKARDPVVLFLTATGLDWGFWFEALSAIAFVSRLAGRKTPMAKPKKPAPPKKASAMDKMIAECVKKAQARKKSGETDAEWRKQYAATLKIDNGVPALSSTPFEGKATRKKE